jgi:hypothetical protein
VAIHVDTRLIEQDVVLYPGIHRRPDPRLQGSGFGLLGLPEPGTILLKKSGVGSRWKA